MIEITADIRIKILQASYGESILLLFNNIEKTSLLIDGGPTCTKRLIVSTLRDVYQTTLNNYVILTHIDDDHINGIKHIFESHSCSDLVSKIKSFYYNTSDCYSNFEIVGGPPEVYIRGDNAKTSYKQGIKLENILTQKGIKVISKLFAPKQIQIDNNINITVLSPRVSTISEYKLWLEKQPTVLTSYNTENSKPLSELIDTVFCEDNSISNASSIAILLEYKRKKVLLLGDAVPSDIIKSLTELGYSKENKLYVDVMKISHHGSKNSTSIELLSLIKCEQFIICTDGHKYHHPDKETIARIGVTQESSIIFTNYNVLDDMLSEEDKIKYHIKNICCEEIII